MSDLNDLASRINAEFLAIEEKAKKFRTEQTEEYQQRKHRLGLLEKALDDLRAIWRPKLETLAKKFGDKVKVKPALEPTNRKAAFAFESELASVHLMFSATADADVRNVLLTYKLEIIPSLMQFEPYSELKLPLEAIDKAAVEKWMDDRIVEFVRTYLAMGENNFYLKEHLVEDPIAHVRFPNFAAATMLEYQGVKYYFISDDTRHEFETQKGIVSK